MNIDLTFKEAKAVIRQAAKGGYIQVMRGDRVSPWYVNDACNLVRDAKRIGFTTGVLGFDLVMIDSNGVVYAFEASPPTQEIPSAVPDAAAFLAEQGNYLLGLLHREAQRIRDASNDPTNALIDTDGAEYAEAVAATLSALLGPPNV